MKFKTLTGAVRTIPKVKNYLIDWEGKSRSQIQKATKDFLKDYWGKHVVFEEFPVAGTKMSLDFYNANKKIAIEVQGQQHTKYTPFFHGNNKYNYINQLRRDQEKQNFCEINDIQLVEIYSTDELTKDFFKKLGAIKFLLDFNIPHFFEIFFLILLYLCIKNFSSSENLPFLNLI